MLELLGKLNLGIRGQMMGMDMDMDFPPAISPTTADQVAISSDASQALFDMLWEALVPLSPTVR